MVAKHFADGSGDIAEVMISHAAMCSLNRIYLPNFCGYQDGFDEVNAAAAQAVLEVTNQRKGVS